MKILFHTFEPSLFGDFKMAAKTGGSVWIPTLLNYLQEAGHHVAFPFIGRQVSVDTSFIADEQIAGMRPTSMKVVDRLEDAVEWADICVFYNRWAMPDRPERHLSYLHQWALIERFEQVKMPYIVFDGDHMITDLESKRILSGFGKIAAPELQPLRSYVRTLMYPNVKTEAIPFSSDRDHSVVYIGNDYGRRQQTIEFLNPLSDEYEVKVFGNWGTTDEAIERNTREMPKVKFMGPLDGSLVVHELSKAKWTVHLMKPSYIDSGFCTFRWVEGAQAGTPAFVPIRFPFPYAPDLPKVQSQFGYAENGKDALMINRLERGRIYQNQCMFVDQFFDSESWLEAIEDCARDRWL